MKKIDLILILFLSLGCQLFAQHILTLDESKQLALENNTKIKNSRLEVKSAEQVRKSALTNYFPNISAGGFIFEAQKDLMEIETEGGDLPVYDGNLENLSGATQYAYMPASTTGAMKNGMVGFINVVQPIFAGGQIINGNKLASLGTKAAGYQNDLTRDEVLLETEKQYWQIVSLDEKYRTVEKYEEMLDSLLAQVADAYNSGVAMKNDFLKVKVKLSETLLNKSKVSNGIKLAQMAFCQHLGIPYDSTLVLQDTLEVKELPQTLYVENSEALSKRDEYNLLKLSVRAEELKTNMKRGEYLPQVGVGLSGMYMKFDESDSRTLGMVFGTVSVPISDWWAGSHELTERSLKEKIAKNNFDNNSELLLLEMEKAWQNLTEAYKQYLLSVQTVDQAEENLEVNRDSYENGLITVSDLLEARAMYQEAKDKLTDAKAGYLTSKTKYLIVTGR